MSNDGRYLVTIGKDSAMKFFDVVAFDMISMAQFDYEPLASPPHDCTAANIYDKYDPI